MNAYRNKHLADAAVYGAKRVQDYCEYRKGQCHIEGLPDCPFIVKTTEKDLLSLRHMLSTSR